MTQERNNGFKLQELKLPFEPSEEFLRRLDLTRTWFWHPKGADGRYRSVYAPPSARLKDISDDEDRKRIVDELIERREERLIKIGEGEILNRLSGNTKIDGRLLAYFPDYTIDDGAAQVHSNGYFEEDDEPGWETWVDFRVEENRQSYLIAWANPNLVEYVQAAIDDNPVNSIDWIENVRTPNP